MGRYASSLAQKLQNVESSNNQSYKEAGKIKTTQPRRGPNIHNIGGRGLGPIGTTYPINPHIDERLNITTTPIEIAMASPRHHYVYLDLNVANPVIHLIDLIEGLSSVFTIDLYISHAAIGGILFAPNLKNMPTLDYTQGAINTLHISARRASSGVSPATIYTVVNAGGSSGVSFPIDYPEEANRGTVTTAQSINFADSTRHSIAMTIGAASVALSFTGATANKLEVSSITLSQDATGGRAITFTTTVINSSSIITAFAALGGSESLSFIMQWERGVWTAFLKGSASGGGVDFPIDFPEEQRGNVGGSTQAIDFTQNTRHSVIMTLTGDISLSFLTPPSAKTAISSIKLKQDATGGRKLTSFTQTVKNGQTIIDHITANNDGGTYVEFVIEWLDGIYTAYLKSGNTVTGGGGAGEFFGPWTENHDAGLKNLTNVKDIDFNDVNSKIIGLAELNFYQTGHSIKNKANPDGGLLYNVNNLQSHAFRSNLIEIARFEEITAGIYRLNMKDHSILNAKDISFDATATFSGSGAVPFIGYHGGAVNDLAYNVPDAAKHIWTSNNTELMGLTGSQLTFAQGLKIQPNPNATNPGISAGSYGGAPTSLINADFWYNSTTNLFQFRQAGITVGLGGSGDPSLWANYPALVDVDVNNKKLTKVQEITFVETGQSLVTSSTAVTWTIPNGDDYLFIVGTVEALKINAGSIISAKNIVASVTSSKDLGTLTTTFATAFVDTIQFPLDAGIIPLAGTRTSITSHALGMLFNVDEEGDRFEFYFDGGSSKWHISKSEIGGPNLILSGTLHLNATATIPVANGFFALNGSDVKVYSGGVLRNLSDITGPPKQIIDGDSHVTVDDAGASISNVINNVVKMSITPTLTTIYENTTIGKNLIVNGDTTLGSSVSDLIKIATDIIPIDDNKQDLGTALKAFDNFHIKGVIYCNILEAVSGESDITVIDDLKLNSTTTIDFGVFSTPPVGSPVRAVTIKIAGGEYLIPCYNT